LPARHRAVTAANAVLSAAEMRGCELGASGTAPALLSPWLRTVQSLRQNFPKNEQVEYK